MYIYDEGASFGGRFFVFVERFVEEVGCQLTLILFIRMSPPPPLSPMWRLWLFYVFVFLLILLRHVRSRVVLKVYMFV